MRARAVATLMTAVAAAVSTSTVGANAANSTMPSGMVSHAGIATSALDSGAAVPHNLRFVQTRVSLLGTHTWYEQVRGHRVVVGGWYAVHAWNDGTTMI